MCEQRTINTDSQTVTKKLYIQKIELLKLFQDKFNIVFVCFVFFFILVESKVDASQ